MSPEKRREVAQAIADAWDKSQPIGEIPGGGYSGEHLVAWIVAQLEQAEIVPPIPWDADLQPVRARLAEALAVEGADQPTIDRILDSVVRKESREQLSTLSKRPDPDGRWFKTAAEGLLRMARAPQAPMIQRAKEFGP